MPQGYVAPANATGTPPVAGEIPNGGTNVPPNTVPNQTTPPADGEPNVQEGESNLPSQNKEVDLSAFELSADVKAKMKDGKLLGRFGSIDEVMAKLKEAEDFRAQHGNNQTNTNTEQQQQAETVKAQDIVGQEILSEFIGNNLELTDAMIQKGVTAGIDARDIKLKAIEIRDAQTVAHAVVGGKENYESMIEWGKANMSDTQKKAYDGALSGVMSEYAIKGLQADYQEALKAGTAHTRIAGQPINQGITPYKSRQELYADKDAAELAKKRGNANDWNIYKKKLMATQRNGGVQNLPRF